MMMVEFKKAKAMQAIFVMIKCALGRTYVFAENLADEVDEISEIYSISRQYDLIAKFYLPKDASIGTSSPRKCKPWMALQTPAQRSLSSPSSSHLRTLPILLMIA